MDTLKLAQHIVQQWQTDITPRLAEYIAIPAKSPLFEPDWQALGHIERAVDLAVLGATAGHRRHADRGGAAAGAHPDALHRDS